MLEVDDVLFDVVIDPLKKGKKFSDVIRILLNGYMTDEYIVRYVEGTLDAFKQKTQDDLQDALNTMKETLAQISFSNEEAMSYVQAGVDSLSSRDKGCNDFNSSFEEAANTDKETITALIEDKKEAEERYKREIEAVEERHKKELQEFREESDKKLKEAKEEFKEESTRQLEAVKKEMENMISMVFKKGIINPTKRELDLAQENKDSEENSIEEDNEFKIDFSKIPEPEHSGESTINIDDFNWDAAEENTEEEEPEPADDGLKESVGEVTEEVIEKQDEIFDKAKEISKAPIESIPSVEEKELSKEDPLNEDIFEVPEDEEEIDLFGEEPYTEEESLDFLNNLLDGQIKSF